jgi:hypothetical protein
LVVEKIRRRDTGSRGHVLHDDRRLAGNVFGEIACEEARGEIVIVAGGMPDDHPDLLVAVEFQRRLRLEATTRHRDDQRCRRHGCV